MIWLLDGRSEKLVVGRSVVKRCIGLVPARFVLTVQAVVESGYDLYVSI